MSTRNLARQNLMLRNLAETMVQALSPLKAASGRLKYLSPFPRRFSGAYESYEKAMEAAGRTALAGYDNDEVTDVSFDQMCKIAPWDYPVLFWMNKLEAELDGLVDAGGHMGTKYRAFRNHLSLEPSFRWIVYDVAAVVRAGRARAQREDCPGLEFVDDISLAADVQLFLGSGLLQYLDKPLSQLISSMGTRPRHLLLNKVALRKGPEVVTLERIGPALVPYRMRNEAAFMRNVCQLGYKLVDRWSIPSLSHVVETHPELGASESAGFYFRLES